MVSINKFIVLIVSLLGIVSCQFFYVASDSADRSHLESFQYKDEYLSELKLHNNSIDELGKTFPKFPIDKQYRIFLYTNQVTLPGTNGFAIPIAEQGKSATDYVIAQLKLAKDDLDYRSSLVIFYYMQKGGHYDVCQDSQIISILIGNGLKISGENSKKYYTEYLSEICP